jgi:putative transposase
VLVGRCRTYRYKLSPTSRQRAALVRLLAIQCELYNAALEERRGVWRWERRSISFFDQCRTLTKLKEVRPEVVEYGVTVCRGSLRRLDLAFQAFYRRCRTGETPGFPRFKSIHRFDSVEWQDRSGWRLKPEHNRVKIMGVGEVRFKHHRCWRGTPKAITIKREGRSWWLSIRCVDVPQALLAPTGREVGIDLGVVNLAATSDGVLVDGPRFARAAAERLAAAQRSLSTKQRGSGNRRRAVERVAACHRKVCNQRRDLAHQLSRSIVNAYDLICVEDLLVTNMLRRPAPRRAQDGTFEPNGAGAKTGLNRSVHDAGWGELMRMLAYKAEDAGRELVAVDPRGTSQRCSACGHIDPCNRRSQAVFCCTACGYEAHADVNAARNVLWAGRALRALSRAGSN